MSSLLVFNRVYRLEIQSVMLVFSSPLVWTSAPLTLSLVHLPPHHLLPCVNKYTVYTYTVSEGWGEYGVTGGGPQQTDRPLPPSTFNGKKSRHLGCGVFIDIWSMVLAIGRIRNTQYVQDKSKTLKKFESGWGSEDTFHSTCRNGECERALSWIEDRVSIK